MNESLISFLQSIKQAVQPFIDFIDFVTWGWALIPFLVIFGIFFCIGTNFVQIRYFGRMFKVMLPSYDKSPKDQISPLQALFISVGGRVGGGNIAGVAVAISLGGPGAVFWMWAIALVGMATSLVECTLAQLYKRTNRYGVYQGGPAYYIIHGMGSNYRWFAVLYALALIASFALGFNAFQGNTVAGALNQSFEVSRTHTGIVFAIITALVVYGGIKRIANVADIVVPIMALCYIAMAVFVIVVNIGDVPALIVSIVKNAFGLEQAVGGGIGVVIMQGMKRGLFSNEAGLGSAPNVAATSYVKHPIQQGIIQSLSVFIDTFMICSATAFMVLLSGAYVPGAEVDGIVLVQESLNSEVGTWSGSFLAVMIVLFAFSSIIYNYYLGEVALSVFTSSDISKHILRICVVGLVFLGCFAEGATQVFFFSDPIMGLLALINLIAIVILFPTVVRLLKDYRAQVKAGNDVPVFDPDKFSDLDIDRDAWTDK